MGSEFEVRLPVSATARPQTNATAIDSKAQGDLRVVIVEDNYDAAEALTMLIELFGHQATIVADGLAAIDAVRDDSLTSGWWILDCRASTDTR